MDIQHPDSSWRMVFNDGRATGPQRLLIDENPLFSFMHCRLDNRSDDAVTARKSHHFHRGGCHVFDGSGVFSGEIKAELGENIKIAANTARVTYDLKWPKNTSLKNGFEAGSLVLLGEWERFFIVTPDSGDEPMWQLMPEPGDPPYSVSPLPAAIVFENAECQRLEIGLGDDLWRWGKGLNGQYLHGSGRLELSRTGNNFSLRRWVTECNVKNEYRAAARLEAKRQDVPGADLSVPVPVSQPDCRQYRFNAYFAWSAGELEPSEDEFTDTVKLACTANGIERAALTEAGDCPRITVDVNDFQVARNARRCNAASGAPCWEARGTQAFFRRVIRQLADYSREGVLILENLNPGWCDTAAHQFRKGEARHWDICAILDSIAWARQILGREWKIYAPQSGIWQELPSLSCLGAESGFRALPDEELPAEFEDEEGSPE